MEKGWIEFFSAANYVLFPQKGITICIFQLTRPSKAGKESFPEKFLLSD